MGGRIRHARLDEDKPLGETGSHEDDSIEKIYLCHINEPFRSILILGYAIYNQQFDSDTD